MTTYETIQNILARLESRFEFLHSDFKHFSDELYFPKDMNQYLRDNKFNKEDIKKFHSSIIVFKDMFTFLDRGKYLLDKLVDLGGQINHQISHRAMYFGGCDSACWFNVDRKKGSVNFGLLLDWESSIGKSLSVSWRNKIFGFKTLTEEYEFAHQVLDAHRSILSEHLKYLDDQTEYVENSKLTDFITTMNAKK